VKKQLSTGSGPARMVELDPIPIDLGFRQMFVPTASITAFAQERIELDFKTAIFGIDPPIEHAKSWVLIGGLTVWNT